jgi:hypothetical protein
VIGRRAGVGVLGDWPWPWKFRRCWALPFGTPALIVSTRLRVTSKELKMVFFDIVFASTSSN